MYVVQYKKRSTLYKNNKIYCTSKKEQQGILYARTIMYIVQCTVQNNNKIYCT